MTPRALHPCAEVFPRMSDAELDQLAADIKANGLREAIWVHPDDGSIIDGRNRYLACERAGVAPTYRTWDGDGSLIAFVVSLNLHRRHLNESQRAMVAARLANFPRGGDRTKVPIGTLLAQGKAAEMLNVSERSVKRAAKVLASSPPSVVAAVDHGKVPASGATLLAGRAPDEQVAIVERVLQGRPGRWPRARPPRRQALRSADRDEACMQQAARAADSRPVPACVCTCSDEYRRLLEADQTRSMEPPPP